MTRDELKEKCKKLAPACSKSVATLKLFEELEVANYILSIPPTHPPEPQLAEVAYKSDIEVDFLDSMGSDRRIVEAMRTSSRVGPDDESEYEPHLLKQRISFLMRNKHGTPFEAGAVQFRINAPIFVWREWHRHRVGWSYNEESARSKTLAPVFYIPDRERLMVCVENWKPGRPKFVRCESDETYRRLVSNLQYSYRVGYSCYQQNLDMGIDPGLARDCLPVGIYSCCYVTANPRSLMHFLSLRTHEPDAKFPSYPLKEIEMAARKIEAKFAELFPITYAAFNEFGRVAP